MIKRHDCIALTNSWFAQVQKSTSGVRRVAVAALLFSSLLRSRSIYRRTSFLHIECDSNDAAQTGCSWWSAAPAPHRYATSSKPPTCYTAQKVLHRRGINNCCCKTTIRRMPVRPCIHAFIVAHALSCVWCPLLHQCSVVHLCTANAQTHIFRIKHACISFRMVA